VGSSGCGSFGTALFVLAVAFISYSDIKAEFTPRKGYLRYFARVSRSLFSALTQASATAELVEESPASPATVA